MIALAICEIGSLAERRIAMLVDPALSGLPAFLTPQPGLNSGFMIPQVTAAALVSENKQRAYPASVDSIPTSANQEDHVSMAAHGARRLMAMAENCGTVIGIELLAAAQGCDFHAPLDVEPAARSGARRCCAARCRISTRTARSIPTSRRRRGLVRSGAVVDGGRLTLARLCVPEEPMTRIDNSRTIRAPRGTTLTAKSWLTEAPLRMLMNNLDPEVAEKPGELVVYGGIGRAARDWESFDRIVAALRALEDDETLLVQSGKPVGVFRTHADAPRVLIANSNLVPHWATWEHFNELDRKGLMMFGQMTAGSWIYIGSQGIVQGTYETFVEMGRQHYGGNLAGRWILTAGLGGMGGAQPLAATMAGASCLAIECQPSRIDMPPAHRYLDEQAQGPRRGAGDHRAARRADEEAGVGRPARQRRRGAARAAAPRRAAGLRDRPDLGARPGQRLPAGGLDASPSGRTSARADPAGVAKAAQAVDGRARRARCSSSTSSACRRVDYGNNIRQMAKDEGVADAFDFPGFVPAYIRPLFCRGIGPFRWVALSGDPEDIYKHRREGEGAVARQHAPAPLARHGARAHRVPGPAGAHLLGRPGRPPPRSASPSTRWWQAAS